MEERAFKRKFKGFVFAVTIISCFTTYWRENILKQRIIRKVAERNDQ